MTAGIIFDAKLDGLGFQTEPLPAIAMLPPLGGVVL